MPTTDFQTGTTITKEWLNEADDHIFDQTGSKHSAAHITNTPAGNIAATDVQTAINELDTEKAKNGVNTDITSLASGLVLSGNPAAFDSSLKVPSTSWTQTEFSNFKSKGGLQNVQLTASVAGNALTVTLTGMGNSNPALSVSNWGTVGFPAQAHTSVRSGVFTLQSNVTLTVPNGATLGTEAGVAARLWVLLVEEGGDSVSLAIQNCWRVSGTSGYLVSVGQASPAATADNTMMTSVTTLDTSSNSAGVVYGTAGSSKPFIVLGCIDITQATPGVWATAPSRVETNPTFRPGEQRAIFQTQDGSLETTTSEVIPDDTSIPQVTEGKVSSILTGHAYAYPGCGPDLVEVEVSLNLSTAAAAVLMASLYRSTDASNVRAATRSTLSTGSGTVQVVLRLMEKRNSVAHLIYNVNYGASTAVVVTLNGAAGAQKLGGTLISSVTVRSISA